MSDTKKSLGQHWLHDEDILNAIVEAGELKSKDTVLEIGSGQGTLTKVLADSNAQVTALEFDRDLIQKLKSKFKNCNNVAIIEGDIRTFDFGSMPENFKVIANIPYYLTSNLIRRFTESENKPSIAVLLVQKEVAERICAKAGDTSLLSIIAQFYFECSLDIVVASKYFSPPPKVDSQVVVMRKRRQLLFDVDSNKFFKLVKAGFSERRKTLPNALSGGLAIEKNNAQKILLEANINLNSRAQELSLDDWYKLYLAYGSSTSPTN